jgi:hypothetical protein
MAQFLFPACVQLSAVSGLNTAHPLHPTSSHESSGCLMLFLFSRRIDTGWTAIFTLTATSYETNHPFCAWEGAWSSTFLLRPIDMT